MVEPSVKSEHGGVVGLVLPPGFRFHPTDEEVITSYLMHKFLNPSFAPHAIGEVDLNKCEPWDLPSKAKMRENSKEWYFFCHKDMKYPTGTRANRATKEGYWKATGKDREIFKPAGRDLDRELVGMRKTLVFYMGRAPRGTKTNWVMHEFRIEGKSRHTCNLRFNPKDEWVVCKVHHKGSEEASAAKKAAAAGEEHYSTATPNVSSVEGGDEFLVDSLLDYSSYFNCSAPGGLPLPSTTANTAAAATATNNDDSSSWRLLRHVPADQQAMVGSYSLHHQAMAMKGLGGGGVTSTSFSAGLPSSPVADYVGNDASGYHTNNY